MIKEIRLKNFKVFQEESFNIKPLTLITGVNGMGKSTLIQSLLFLKQNYELGYLSNPKKKLRLKHDFVNLESAGDICYTFAEEKVYAYPSKKTTGTNINGYWTPVKPEARKSAIHIPAAIFTGFLYLMTDSYFWKRSGGDPKLNITNRRPGHTIPH